MGYHRAGFDVVGVDKDPQPNYPFRFIRGDALHPWTWMSEIGQVSAVHASPPCQLFTVYRNNHRQMYKPVQNLIPHARSLLQSMNVPYVIENVPRAPLIEPIQLCGTSFPPLEVRRHRLFESNVPLTGKPCDHGRLTERKYPGSSNRPNGRTVCNIGEYRVPLAVQKQAIGIDWMTLEELSEAIPPAYTEFIGNQLMEHLYVSR
jgi:DNA (cytosine-5)-methyltransferase 1